MTRHFENGPGAGQRISPLARLVGTAIGRGLDVASSAARRLDAYYDRSLSDRTLADGKGGYKNWAEASAFHRSLARGLSRAFNLNAGMALAAGAVYGLGGVMAVTAVGSCGMLGGWVGGMAGSLGQDGDTVRSNHWAEVGYYGGTLVFGGMAASLAATAAPMAVCLAGGGAGMLALPPVTRASRQFWRSVSAQVAQTRGQGATVPAIPTDTPACEGKGCKCGGKTRTRTPAP